MALSTWLLSAQATSTDNGSTLVVFYSESLEQTQLAYGDPYQKPTGIIHVIEGGRHVVQDSTRIEGIYPGRKLLRAAP